MKRAAIYVRVSKAYKKKGETRVSIEEQMADCEAYCEEHGYAIVARYVDKDKYRVGGKLKTPSGENPDRPSYQTMLRAAQAEEFDVIVAWKEDRLYRGIYAAIPFSKVLDERRGDLLVELVKETFDRSMLEIKAAIGKIELDNIRERTTMGVKARLRVGKANTGQDRYGYKRNGEVIELVEEEARWVRQIFAWYVERIPLMEIRRRLIEADAPQKGSSVPRKIRWARSSIQGILTSAKVYASGIKTYTRDGEVFEIPIPTILDMETYHRFLKVRKANKKNKARNVKHDYLIRGLLYCDCNRKWGARSRRWKYVKGKRIERKTRTGDYYCREIHKERVHPDCPRTIGSKKADDQVWSKICEVLSNPEALLIEAQKPIAELQQQAVNIQVDQERLQKELDALTMERQWVITQARKGRITDEDMDYQLGALTLQELDLKRKLVEFGEVARLNGFDNWQEVAREYLASLHDGLEELNTTPKTKEERLELFKMKREIVLALVERIQIGKDRKLTLVFKLDVYSLLKPVGLNEDQIEPDGTCSRRQLSLPRRRSAFCASPSPPACRC